MNKNDTSLDQKIILAYYGELSEAEQQQLASLEKSDATLHERSELFRQSFDRIKQSEPEAIDEHVLDRLERSILNATVRAESFENSMPVSKERHASFWASLRELFLTPQRIGFTLAGGLAFMVLGVYIGSQLQITQPPVVNPSQADQSAASSSSVPLIAASQQVTDFLKRSQIYFATSVDHEVLCEKCLPIQEQLPNRQIAKELLKEASALKKEASGNPEIQKLITDIEYVLDNIGNNVDINPSQAEVVHHIASNAVCEVAARIDSANLHRQNQAQQPK